MPRAFSRAVWPTERWSPGAINREVRRLYVLRANLAANLLGLDRHRRDRAHDNRRVGQDHGACCVLDLAARSLGVACERLAGSLGHVRTVALQPAAGCGRERSAERRSRSRAGSVPTWPGGDEPRSAEGDHDDRSDQRAKSRSGHRDNPTHSHRQRKQPWSMTGEVEPACWPEPCVDAIAQCGLDRATRLSQAGSRSGDWRDQSDTYGRFLGRLGARGAVCDEQVQLGKLVRGGVLDRAGLADRTGRDAAGGAVERLQPVLERRAQLPDRTAGSGKRRGRLRPRRRDGDRAGRQRDRVGAGKAQERAGRDWRRQRQRRRERALGRLGGGGRVERADVGADRRWPAAITITTTASWG